MSETPINPAENDTAAPVCTTGMMSGDACKPPPEHKPDPLERNYAMADALRRPKPTTTEEGS